MTSPKPTIAALRSAYTNGTTTPTEEVSATYARIEAALPDPTWIHRIPRERALAAAGAVKPEQPLAGVPFAIKDNIDLSGTPTTAACPEYAYVPTSSAPVVQRLLAAGAIPVGKTNLDQFATGLVGVRSPYGVPRNPYHAEYLPGGSSSGSAVAVANGHCAFSLGTDTAGSGRIPASFNNLVGLKPTRGLLSTRGVVPACRTLDCVSVFTHTCADAAAVFSVAAGFDPEDPFSRPAAPPTGAAPWPPRVGVPRPDQLAFFGNAEAPHLFRAAIERWQAAGARIVEIDFAPFRDAARLLYEGAWVAERYTALRTFMETQADALHPVTRQILEGAKRLSAADAFESSYRLATLRRSSERVWTDIDLLLTPTAGTIYRVENVLQDPLGLNSNLGYYTNFFNLLDLCGLALPAGFYECGVPFGVTISAPAFHDDHLLAWGARLRGEPIPPPALRAEATPGSCVRVAVCGAHMSGLPLNVQLTARRGRLVSATKTAPHYRLFALPNTSPPKPGLVRVASGGASIELEVWELPTAEFGGFLAGIPAPLGIGTLSLENGETVHGFLCESVAIEAALDISRYGGWRAYLQASRQG